MGRSGVVRLLIFVILCSYALSIAFADGRAKHTKHTVHSRVRHAGRHAHQARHQAHHRRQAAPTHRWSLSELSANLRKDPKNDDASALESSIDDPMLSLRSRIEDIKEDTDQKIQQMNHDQELGDLQAKLERMNQQRRVDSERSQSGEITGLEGRIDKMEQTTKDLKKAAAEQLDLLKQIQNRRPVAAIPQEESAPPPPPLTPLDIVFKKLTGELNESPNSVTITSPRLVNQINSYATLANAPVGTPYGLESVPSGLVRPRIVDRNYISSAYQESGFDDEHLNNIALNPAVHNQFDDGEVLSRVTDDVGHESHLPSTLELYPTLPGYKN